MKEYEEINTSLERFCDEVNGIFASLCAKNLDDKSFAAEVRKLKEITWKPVIFYMKNNKLKNVRELLSNYKLLTQNQLEKYLKLEKRSEKKYFKEAI